MTPPDDDQLCPDCQERQQPPDDRHAIGCRYDAGLVPIGAPYQVTAPDGTTLHGIGRHQHPTHAVLTHDIHNGWRPYSSHTTSQAAHKAIDTMPTRDRAATVVRVDRDGSHGTDLHRVPVDPSS